MRFIGDNALPPALARFRPSRGVRTAHVADLDLQFADDHTIWEFAGSNGAGVITKDADFAHIARESPGPILSWIKLGNCNTRVLLETVADRWAGIEILFANGVQVVEVRQGMPPVRG